MRNIMICVSVMLAIFLGWPLAFGGHRSVSLESSVEARSVVPASVPGTVKLVQASAAQSLPAATSTKPESCYKRYQREIKLCTGSSSAACRLKSADNWDLCEATGFWPQ